MALLGRLGAFLQRAMETVRGRWERRGLSLTWGSPPDLPLGLGMAGGSEWQAGR